ncbi:hypothetical protein O2W18_09680 [Modestobacter sp. VKM Ac-2983]|uniref:hypothetical protein n=1 Tax=Modestobacter sp. VKM Ac-2983 TaxID=3004137 RepID=UPI0022AB8A7A|nr:hypothetical protein [Modestobacter sp. VKM Ac-2983]MCZ2805371.1 hypothetical protein [Modestobacter sp. VKM Ac-2983]
MSRADNKTVPGEQIDATIAELDRSLRRLHLTRSDRRTVLEEVRVDLQAAADDGVSPAALIDSDIDAFAREAIEVGGYIPRPRDYPRVLLGGILTAVGVVVAAYVLIVLILTPLLSSWFTLPGSYPSAGPLLVYGALVLAGLIGTLAGLRWLLAGRPAARATLRKAALLLPIGAAAGIAGLLAVADDPDYRTTEGTVTVQALLVVLGVAVALGIARWWALRTTSDDTTSTSATP